jgi:hypothetical protein
MINIFRIFSQVKIPVEWKIKRDYDELLDKLNQKDRNLPFYFSSPHNNHTKNLDRIKESRKLRYKSQEFPKRNKDDKVFYPYNQFPPIEMLNVINENNCIQYNLKQDKIGEKLLITDVNDDCLSKKDVILPDIFNRKKLKIGNKYLIN